MCQSTRLRLSPVGNDNYLHGGAGERVQGQGAARADRFVVWMGRDDNHYFAVARRETLHGRAPHQNGSDRMQHPPPESFYRREKVPSSQTFDAGTQSHHGRFLTVADRLRTLPHIEVSWHRKPATGIRQAGIVGIWIEWDDRDVKVSFLAPEPEPEELAEQGCLS